GVVVRMAAGAATGPAIVAAESSRPSGPRQAHQRVPRWALEEDRLLAEDDVLVHVARSWQPAIVGPMPAGDHADVISGGIPVPATWTEVPVARSDGSVVGQVLACLIGERDRTIPSETPPFTLA